MSDKSVKQRGLGRGLNALFEDDEDISAESSGLKSSGYAAAPDNLGRDNRQKLPIESLRPGQSQPRQIFDEKALDQLAASIKEHGLLQPLIVRALAGEADNYEIIAGERRWRAAQRAQLHEIPVVLMELSDTEALEIALVENLQREDLNAVEEALGYRRLMDEYGHTQEKLADILGKSRPHIANMVRLLTLPESVLALLEQQKLSIGHARALVGAKNVEELAQEIVKNDLTVRQTEAMVSSEGGQSKSSKSKTKQAKDSDTRALENDLTTVLGMKVSIDHKNKKRGSGVLQIQYKSLDQLDDVLSRLNGVKESKRLMN